MFLMGACAMNHPMQQQPIQAQPMSGDIWQQKADNLVLVVDASSSMAKEYKGFEKFSIARNVVANFNQTMPDLPIKAELRSFGHAPEFSDKVSVLSFGLCDYSREGLAEALGKITPAGGPSPMAKSLKAAAEDLKAARGNIAMLVISDGKDMDATPLEAANALKAQYGDRLCIYTVLIGDDKAGSALLTGISAVTACGQAITADNIASGPAMESFVTAVLLEKAHHAPAPKAACPELSKAGTWVFKDIKFEIDKDVLMASSYPTLDEIVRILTDHPEISVEIQGHTDSTASEAYNMDLSLRRAHTVMIYLQNKGIGASRMTAEGYGESRPMDTNDTAEGRSNNRRVELKPMK
jgi:OOP family OmpA-OmpF porin